MYLLPSSLLFGLVALELLDYHLSSLFDLMEARFSLLVEALCLEFHLQTRELLYESLLELGLL